MTLRHIFITHSHWDHVEALPQFRAAWPKARLHSGSKSAPVDQRNKNSEIIHLGGLRVTHRETPGHAEDGVTYLIGNWQEDAPHVAVVGDTIFAGSMGNGNGAWELAQTKNPRADFIAAGGNPALPRPRPADDGRGGKERTIRFSERRHLKAAETYRLIFLLDIHIESMYSVPMIRKELVAASAEPLILSLLAKGESYGYAIIQEVKARSDGKLNWTDGMLYPVLHRMEHRGLIKSRWGESETGRKRKYYSLKKDGKTAMAKHHEQWSLVHTVLSGLKKEQYV